MRIAVIGDTHLGRSLYQYDLTPRIREVMYQFFEVCVQEKVTRAIHLGDLFDTPRPSLIHQKIALQWCNEFERAGINLTLLVGNHDASSSPGISSALDVIRAFPYKHVHVVDRPLWQYRRHKASLSGAEEFALFFLPFPSPSLYKKEKEWKAEIKSAWDKSSRCPVLVFSHLNVDKAVLGDQEWMYRGGDYSLPKAVEKHKRVSVVVNGHIHKQQEIRGSVFCLGASYRLRFDEKTNPVEFLLMDPTGHSYPVPVKDVLELRQIDLDVSGFAHAGKPPTTEEIIKTVQHMDVEGCIVKLYPVVDSQSIVDWAVVQDFLYEEKGVEYAFLGAPIRVKKREENTVEKARIGEPLKVAQSWIKQRVDDKKERREVYSRFKRIQEKVDGKSSLQRKRKR